MGRLRNFTTITASIVASGNVLNNVLATPTGTSATGTSSTAINVTVSSIANATAYRFFASDTQTGTFVQLVQQTGATFAHTGLTASQTKWYKIQYVGGGFYDDSAMGAAFSGATLAAAASQLDPSFVIDGDSISTEDYATGWHADFQTELTNQLAAKTLAQLNAVGFTATAPVFAWVGVSGQTTAQMTAAARPNAAFVTGKSNVLLTIAEPYNSLRYPNATATAASAANDYATYCTARKTANAWKGIVGLMGFDDNYRGTDTNFNPPRTGFAQLQADMITAVRGRMSSGTAGVDVLAIVDPLFDQTVAAQSADGVHPTRAAYAASLTKRLVAGVMEMLFGTVQPAAIPRSADLIAGATFLEFPTQNGSIVTTGNTVTSSKGGNVYGALGLCNYKLPAAGAGWYAAEIYAADALNAITAFSDVNAYAGYATGTTRAGFFRDASGLNVISNGTYIANVGTCAVGDFVRVRRAGTALTLEKSTDRGITWSLVYTYAYTSAADLFLIADIYTTGKLYYTQGMNMVPSSTNTVPNLIPGASYINLPTTAKVGNSNNIVYSRLGTATGAYGGTQVPVVKLPAGTSGYIAYRFAQPDAFDSVLFFRDDYVEGGYTTAKAGSWVSSGSAATPGQLLARYDAGASGGGTINAPVIGEFFRIRRDTTVARIYLERSTDGTTWTLAYTYTYYSAADLFVAIDISGPGLLYYPQGVGLVAAP